MSNAESGLQRFFEHATVAACAVIEDKMVPGCVEVVQKIERQSPLSGVTVSSHKLLYEWELSRQIACKRDGYAVV